MNSILFAAEGGPHVAIAPEKLFEAGGYAITNSMFYGWIIALVATTLLIAGARKISIKGAQGPAKLLDAGTDFLVSMVEGSLGSREKALKYTPVFATIFFFILLNNWLGLLPGVGPAIEYNGNPLLRPFTADLNGTLAMALVGILIVQMISIKENGPLKHAKHYFPGKMTNPLTYLIGVFEVFTEATRLFSLGLRLFLNVTIGEILIGIFAYLGGAAAPLAALPFTLLEIFVGLLQAYIFVILCVSYLSVNLSHEHEPSGEPLM
jgi:F-type H+-transporting ATPase subunit a